MVMQSLDGLWQLARAGSKETLTAQVPGCVHLDLMSAGIIDDPFFRDNEYKVAWVHETDWVYTRVVEADVRLFECDRVFLECDGLDTLASTSLNGKSLGRADNMYVPHRFDVTNNLRRGENRIGIKFQSPVTFTRPLCAKNPLKGINESIPGAVYIRKSPCQWGWDWGPKLPTSGIWRPIRLAGYKIARIDDLWVRQKHHSDGNVTLNVVVAIEKFRRDACTIMVRLTHPDGTVQEQDIAATGKQARCSISVQSPKLWWPNGYGDHPLYKIEAILKHKDETLSSVSRRIGLRTIKLEQKKDRWGRSFTFVVNGVKVFCKGADWIPADQFPSRITDDHYRHLVSSAAQANMNMLRVWGGGFYESDLFYDLCDEYGVLIWQDFMFACSHYPCDDWYLDNARRDIEHTVIRLRNHPSLALWCGNNEMEWGATHWWDDEVKADRQQEYAKIFHEMIPDIISRVDPGSSYWPSSPSSGQPYFGDVNDPSCGDGHYWDVWHGKQPFTAYRSQYHRFMSEFGFESLPALETIKSFAREGDLNVTSYVMECHQKSAAGNGLLLHYMAQTFRFPKDFEMICYASQLLQAEAMRCGIEHWRRNRGRCMGALYWQYNDCWPVCSWAGIDYFGRWKALQYFAKRFYSPVHLSVEDDGVRAKIHVTNDTTTPVFIEMKWSLERLDGTVVRQAYIKKDIPAERNILVANLDFVKELKGDAIRQTVLVHEFMIDGKRVGMGITPFVPSKHLELPEANIRVDVKSDDIGPYLEIATDKAARFVCLSIPGQDVIFSDNYFDLPAGRTNVVRVESEIDPSLLAQVRVYSLRDSY